MNINFLKKCTVVILTINLFGCALLPKKEISDAEINAQAEQAYQEIKAKSKMSTNKKWTEMVQRVGQRIAKASGENFKWEVILIESNEVNAWCMPGGKMAVYTGIMPVLKNEGALAAVMGHEVAHATLRHGKKGYARAIEEQQASLILVGAAVVGGELLCKTEQCKQLSRLSGAAAGLALSFFNRKFSRADESDADKEGQLYMATAGYDPKEATHLWERMAAASGGKSVPEFMSTHPSDEKRKGQLENWLGSAEQIYENSPVKYGIGESI